MFDYKNEEKNYNPLYMHNYFYVSKIIVQTKQQADIIIFCTVMNLWNA